MCNAIPAFTMSVTIEDLGKWQPSVLHLLPFSKNNASAASPLVSAQSNQQTSYTTEASDKGLPSLGFHNRGREKPRSKSAAVIDDKLHLQKQQQQHRLFRASSERLSRSPKKSANRNFIERARSEYTVKSERKLTQEVVSFAIKDINEQILGQNLQNENESLNSDRIPTIENGRYKVKPLLKPVLKHEGRWPQINARFWRSSTISPGERELQRHNKTPLDVQLSSLKQSKMVKLNVKDLPRSQTPIGENDPDKLNMKQVIAFLQSSGEVRDADNDITTNNKRRLKNKTNNKTDNSKDEVKANGNNDNATVLLIAAKSRRKDESSDSYPALKSTEIIARPHDSNHFDKPDSNDKDTVAKTDNNNNNFNPAVKPRPNSYSGEIISSELTERSKHYQDKTDNNQSNTRPKSLQFLAENTEFRIPARIRQIRESTIDNRPFRLHRFLTLVSNAPDEEKHSANKKVNDRINNDNHSRFTSSSLHNGNNNDNNDNNDSRSSSNLSRITNYEDEKHRRSYTDSKRYFLTKNISSRTDHGKKKEERRSSKHSHNKTNSDDSNENDKIICLPTAPVEVDSDDDNFISLPTVPSKSTRKDLVLSAHGHAILAKHFPQVKTFQKAIIRPHSEKITLKRRLDIDNDLKTRPSSVKPSDLVEWAGVPSPERIFLTDQSDPDPAFQTQTSFNNSNVTRKPSDPAVLNGELHSNNLQKDTPVSPSRSEKSSPTNKIMNSPTRSKTSDIMLSSEKHKTDASSESSKEAVVGQSNPKNSNGAKSKLESASPSSSDPVKLTLRKERNLTRELTYMVDMKTTGNARVEQWKNNHKKDPLS